MVAPGGSILVKLTDLADSAGTDEVGIFASLSLPRLPAAFVPSNQGCYWQQPTYGPRKQHTLSAMFSTGTFRTRTNSTDAVLRLLIRRGSKIAGVRSRHPERLGVAESVMDGKAGSDQLILTTFWTVSSCSGLHSSARGLAIIGDFGSRLMRLSGAAGARCVILGASYVRRTRDHRRRRTLYDCLDPREGGTWATNVRVTTLAHSGKPALEQNAMAA
jgi:hypothetical protein